MTKEELESLNRFRRNPIPDDYAATDQEDLDILICAQGFQSEHPADDNQPPTEEFFRSIGFEGPRFDLDRLRLDLGRLRVTNYHGWNLHVRSQEDERSYMRIFNDLKTRRQVRLAVELFS